MIDAPLHPRSTDGLLDLSGVRVLLAAVLGIWFAVYALVSTLMVWFKARTQGPSSIRLSGRR